MEDIEKEKVKMQLWVLKLMAITLAGVMGAVVFVMLIGLFLPNSQIDNNEIFKILGPAFSMVIGAFVGSFATMMGMKTEPLDPNAKLQQLGTADYTKTAQAEELMAKTVATYAAQDEDDEEDHGPH